MTKTKKTTGKGEGKMTTIEHSKELTKIWIGSDFGDIGIVGWTTFDQDTTESIMESMVMEVSK